ncbi:MAG: hypothetical protein F4X87_03670 [Chloroflexi bacterium]|nr:hypothetical protein [Chloroflexota bacterium]
MNDEPQTEQDILSYDFGQGPGLKDGGYAIIAVDVLTNHYDFTCADMSETLELIAKINGKHITELQLPRDVELANWSEEPCEPYALALTLDNGASLWLPLIDMDGEDGLFGVHTDMVEETSEPFREASHNEAATAAVVSRAARRREEKAARKAAKRRKTT